MEGRGNIKTLRDFFESEFFATVKTAQDPRFPGAKKDYSHPADYLWWGCTSLVQSTHSLKVPGFNPGTYDVISWFQAFAFKCNLHRYTLAAEHPQLAVARELPAAVADDGGGGELGPV